MSLQRTVIWHDSGLCGACSDHVGCDVLGKFISNPKVSNSRPASRNSLTDDVIIGLKFSRTTRRQTTFSDGSDS